MLCLKLCHVIFIISFLGLIFLISCAFDMSFAVLFAVLFDVLLMYFNHVNTYFKHVS
jgi:hypothetical protein